MRVRSYPDKNYKAVFTKSGKTLHFKHRKDEPYQELAYPEILDVSVNNKCMSPEIKVPGIVGCEAYCYVAAKKTGHNYDDIVGKAKKYWGSMKPEDRPFQIACLDKSEYVATPNGLKPIGDIEIGDSVLSDSGQPAKVINKVSSRKQGVRLIGNKGFNVTCTPDHLFQLDDGSVNVAQNLVGHRLATVPRDNTTWNLAPLDLAPYAKPSSRVPGRRGGASGGTVKKDTVRLMHTLPFVPRYIEIDHDLMWFYGLVTAEGFSRGIALHKKEIAIANRAIKIYSKITGGLGAAIRPNKENGITVEFYKPLVFRSIFFGAMRQAHGARNKNLSFCFGMPKGLVQSALLGLFDGDGAYMEGVDKRYDTPTYKASLKTSSCQLALEVNYLLRWKFGIHPSVIKGRNGTRFIDGRELPKTKYYVVAVNKNSDVAMLFPDRFSPALYEFKYNKKSLNAFQDYIEIKEIQDVGEIDAVDVTVDCDSHLFAISHGVITHNCGGAGEPTMHPDFPEFLKTVHDLGIMGNYTTNSLHLSPKVLDATEKYAGGVAITCHAHLEKHWRRGIEKLTSRGIRTNLHIIPMSMADVDKFVNIFNEYKDVIEHFVLLPYQAIGFGKPIDMEPIYEYLFDDVLYGMSSEERQQVAYGAYFYDELKKREWLKADLYEHGLLSKYLDMDGSMSLHPSSYDWQSPPLETNLI